MSVLTIVYSLLEANQLKWLTDFCADRVTGHVCSDYNENTFARQSAELGD
jgi:hypothetical protein